MAVEESVEKHLAMSIVENHSFQCQSLKIIKYVENRTRMFIVNPTNPT